MKITILLGLLCLVSHARSAAMRLPSPRNVKVVDKTTTTARLEWRQPPGAPYISFNIRIRPRATIDLAEDKSQTYRTFRDLRPGRQYIATITGVTKDGRQSPTVNCHFWTMPLPPTNLEIQTLNEVLVTITVAELDKEISITSKGIYIKWDLPDGDTGVNGYKVEIDPNEGSKLFERIPDGDTVDATSRLITGLKPGQDYSVSVRTKVGPPYAQSFSVPLVQNLLLPPEAPLVVKTYAIGSTHVQIKVIGPLSPFDSRELVIKPEGGVVTGPKTDSIFNKFDIYIITNLLPDTNYTLDVYSVSTGILSEVPKTITFTTKSAVPRGLEVTDFDSTSVQLIWEPPEFLMADAEIEYVIEYVDTRNISNRMEIETGLVPTGGELVNSILRGLKPGITYRISVSTSINGERSEVQAEVTQTTVPLVPRVTSIVNTDDGIVIIIEGPDEEGECPFVIVDYSPNINGTDPTPQTYETGTEIFLAGVTSKQKFTLTARCISDMVEGEQLVFFSTDIVNLHGETVESDKQKEEASKLPCLDASIIRPGTGSESDPTRSPETIKFDACCGDLPYHRVKESCCGVHRLQNDDMRLCCIDTPYNRTRAHCCTGGRVRSLSVSCTDR